MNKLVVITASQSAQHRSQRLGEALAATISQVCESEGLPTTLTHIAVRDYIDDMAAKVRDPHASTAHLDAAIAEVHSATALIAVSPVYQGSYSGLFKSFIDFLPQRSLRAKPMVIGAAAGSTRYSLMLEYSLRPLFSNLHALVMPTGIFATPADEDHDFSAAVHERMLRAGEELAAQLQQSTPS